MFALFSGHRVTDPGVHPCGLTPWIFAGILRCDAAVRGPVVAAQPGVAAFLSANGARAPMEVIGQSARLVVGSMPTTSRAIPLRPNQGALDFRSQPAYWLGRGF